MLRKKCLLLVVLGLVTLLAMGCASEGENENRPEDSDWDMDEIVASVSGTEITRGEFEGTVARTRLSYEQQGANFTGEQGEAMLDQIREQAINTLVHEELLLQEAREKGFEATQEAVEEELEGAKAQYPSEEEFATVLEANYLNEDDFKKMIANNMVIDEFLQSEIEEAPVSDEDVQQLYDQYAAQTEDMPALEDVKSQLELEISQQNQQAQIGVLIEQLMEKSEVEIFI